MANPELEKPIAGQDQNHLLPERAADASPSIETPDRERIARRAYERFQMRGGETGRDQEDWFEAERELNGGGDQR